MALRQQIVIRMRDQEIERLEQMAKLAGKNKSELVRDLVKRCEVEMRPTVFLTEDQG